MPLTRLIIKNFKSIKNCDISLSELNVLIGENGTGKTNLLDAINYFYRNLTDSDVSAHVFDENNHYSNELQITLVYDLSQFVKISKSNSGELPDIFEDQSVEKTKYGGYYKAIISMASKSKDRKLCVELSQIKGNPIRWNYSYEDRLIFKSLFPIFYIDTRNLDVTEWGYLWDVLGELGKVSNAERKTIETKINDILLDDRQEISRKLKGITDIFSAADVSVKPAMSREFAKNLTKVFFSGEIIRQREKQLGYYSTGTNSVKYMDKKKGIINIRILDVGDFIQVELGDNGKGIAAKELPYVFDRFYRTDASRNSSKGGSGIGLSIVKKIVEEHGGNIWATSEEGAGTTMYFVIRKYQEVPIDE